jgi:hypothetical protein
MAVFFNFTASYDANAAITEVKTIPLSAADSDAYILYSYSLSNGETAEKGDSVPTISVIKENDGIKYVYNKHTLSCGTVMTGWIRKSVKGTVTRYTCSFEVSNNEYKINMLNGDYTINSKDNSKKGFIIANDRKIDINLF